MTAARSDLAARLDLGTCDSHEELVSKLRAARAFQLEALERPDPPVFPLDTREKIRASRLAEVALCEEALLGFGEPFEAPEPTPSAPFVSRRITERDGINFAHAREEIR